jgi:hypothetical protein
MVMSEFNGVGELPAAVVDLDKSFYTTTLVNQLLSSPSIEENIEAVLTDEEHAFKLLRDDKIAGVLVIPAGFTEGTLTGNFLPLTFYANPLRPYQVQLISEGLDSGAHLVSSVQNALYAVYRYVGELPITRGELDGIFNRQMIALISTAMSRNDIYVRVPSTPWGGKSMEIFYALNIVLFAMLFTCFRCIGAYFEADGRFYTRVRLSGAPGGMRLITNIAASFAALTFYGLCLMSVVVARTGIPITVMFVMPVIALSMAVICVFAAAVSGSMPRAVLIWVTAMLLMAPDVLHFLNIQLFSPVYWWRLVLLNVIS